MAATMQRLPIIDWRDVEGNRTKFLTDVLRAFETIGFAVLVNHPDFTDATQQRLFREARGFFEAPDAVKETANIANTPYFRGWSRTDMEGLQARGKLPPILAQEAYQYGFDRTPVAPPDDASVPLYKRVLRGPNSYPDAAALPGFKSAVDYLEDKYHQLTHDLGYLICESLGVPAAEFDKYFDKENPSLVASFNHNYGMGALTEANQKFVKAEFAKHVSKHTGAHIDGNPFLALLINDSPGLQVVAGAGRWIDAPVTCARAGRAAGFPQDVIPGAVIVNAGGTLMHLSGGRVCATLHRVNPMLIPDGETRVSLPFFLLPKMEGALEPWPGGRGTTGYRASRNRGDNAVANRLMTFPSCTRRWWREEFTQLRETQRREVAEDTAAAYDLAAGRAVRNQQNSRL
eukprot:TRINITY_DN6524_c2_g1_i1.p1 TRINITY_DN6524_c2_g1~~TRINITY_DN6524_c2_g1_i1.p1  ORF type:complete len:402 (+),score=135.74 TRINITY_DN6524_c2_g1_i1:88-1293(+)